MNYKEKEAFRRIIEEMEYKEETERGSNEFEKGEILREQGFNSFRRRILKALEDL